MAPIIEQPRPESPEFFEPRSLSQQVRDVPGLLADRVGALYAAAERRDRTERTERLIRRAAQLQ
jgi:hypothetical protein